MPRKINLESNPKVSWLSNTGLLLIKTYRLHFSGVLGGCCRFHPTCSCYAEEAFKEHTFMKAFCLTLKRLLRCHPFTSGGFDPVPAPRRNHHVE